MKRPYNEVARIAAEAWNTMLRIEGINVVGSWGVSKKYVLEYRDMPSLALQVDGTQFTGIVIISLNEGKDYYEVRLTEVNPLLLDDNSPIKQTVTDVFFDELGRTIDQLVERPLGMSDEDYNKISSAHTIKRFTGQ